MKKMIRPGPLAEAWGWSLTTLWRTRRDDATFPPAYRIGKNSIAFAEDELNTWLRSKRVAPRGRDLEDLIVDE